MKQPSSNAVGNAHRSFADVNVGDTLPQQTFDFTLAYMAMYAAGTWDFHRGHYDYSYAQKSGFAAPFVDGQMIGAIMARDVMAWGGASAFLRVLDYRVRAVVYQDEQLVFSGEIVEKKVTDGHSLVVWKLNVNKPDGTEVVKDAEAVIELDFH